MLLIFPMLIRWPSHIKAGTVTKERFATFDWVPMFVELDGGLRATT
jgi:arylsulfatase A-like enzyme